jgi:hypothetical protein
LIRLKCDIPIVEYKQKFYGILSTWLPLGAKEGDVVVVKLVVDENETARRGAIKHEKD